MRTKQWVLWFMLVFAMVLTVTGCGSDNASTTDNSNISSNSSPSGSSEGSDFPATVSIGTHATGGAFHAVGSGLAQLISDYTSMRGIVQPTAGPNAWMNDLNSGNMDFGLLSATDSAWAYTGGPGFDKPAENFRLVLQGNFVYNSGFGVKADGSINSIKDLKGKKVASDYGGNIFTNQLAVASLAAAGLTWNDVAQVPVPQINSGLDLLQNGTVHATQAASPTTPKTLEVDSAIGGIKLLNFGDVKPEDIQNGIPEEVQAIIDKEIPGVTLKVAPAAFQPGFGSRSIMPPLFMNLGK